ncbi:hypothetical protein PR202_ga20891 [Eleusine coracana subsp. coracana]|uniref:Trehalose 6-phosphate phosphatase n=1 Tax=Eleusine coracana subsp. coracana TaxID=191504 RepID=A0AAV5CZY1_ELECO|nr:hypothetical protein PR202_ga20891 [Eleusine coracana subsp. coracana]
MTKQSVVVPAPEAAAAAMMPPNTAAPLLPYPPPRAVRKRYQQKMEHVAGSCWVDSMRASSSTHAKAAAALAAGIDEDHAAWMVKHPSALAKFDQVVAASKGKQIVVFLDYDGTLSPIVDDPDAAYMSDTMRRAVRSVAKHFPTAIVSGRCRDKVFEFVKLAELYYAGSHGMDIKGPAKASRHTKAKPKRVLFQPASEFLPMIQQVHESLLEKTKCIPGAKVENNKFCVSVHFRCVDEKDYPKLKLTQGRMVFEVRPTIKWDKGKALEFLLESLGFADCSDVLPVYIGDDRTDEDAFKVLRKRGQGIGILVSNPPLPPLAAATLTSLAPFLLQVMEFLLRLVEWERLTKFRPKW